MSNHPRPGKAERRPVSVLLVEDQAAAAARVQTLLAEARATPFQVTVAESLKEGLDLLARGEFHAAVLDTTLPDATGLEGLARLKAVAAGLPVVVLLEEEDEELAIQALRQGAHDYLVKSEADVRLTVRTLRHAVERHRMLRDLSVARRREYFLATHCGLTGLGNRWSFLDQLARALVSAARNRSHVAVLYLDLDRFKAINDTLGHDAGDELLKAVAERVSAATRESDMVARLGGDEFIVLLEDLRRDHDPAKVAEIILDALARPFPIGEREYWATGSIGIAVYPRDGSDPETLIRNADAAMHHAKKQGPNRYRFYADGMNAAALELLELETALREALEREELFVCYQPQVDARRGTLVGVEALVRWQHPIRGLVSPGEFIPVAEETGIIHAIGEWVLRTACADAARWIAAGVGDFRVAVNVSSRQLGHKGFGSVVARALRDSGLEPRRLELEITESSVMQERGVTLAALLVARKLGVGVAIDDFGTGYSSLTALKRLPVDAIKIDRSFVRNSTVEPADATITSALIRMGHGLGMRVIAEGVETPEQLAFLRAEGCHLMQGFLFAKPVPVAEFERQLASGREPWRPAGTPAREPSPD